MGALLAEMNKHKGGRPPENPLHDERGLPAALKEIGISYIQSSRWQKIASLADERFEELLAGTEKNRGTATRSHRVTASPALPR